VEGGVERHKNRRVEAANSRSQEKKEGKKGNVSTPGDGRRSEEPKPLEATTKQTEENDSPKVDADTHAEAQRICATSGNHELADVENPDY
jgi:hypothetical protein